MVFSPSLYCLNRYSVGMNILLFWFTTDTFLSLDRGNRTEYSPRLRLTLRVREAARLCSTLLDIIFDLCFCTMLVMALEASNVCLEVIL